MLETLHFQGLKPREIAEKLGGFADTPDQSRNAVIGKIHRLGIGRGRTPATGKPTMKRQQKPRFSRPPEGFAVPPREPELPPDIFDGHIPLVQRKTLFQLEPRDCRWPVGTPSIDLFFCGGYASEGSSYCLHHTRRASGRQQSPSVSPG